MDSELSPVPGETADEELRRARPGIVFRMHQGLVRSNNEDWCGWAVEQGRATFVVCDGMGGHEHGEHASRAAGREFLAAFQDRRRGLPDVSDLAARLEARLEELKSSFGVEKMGTTLTGLVMRGNGARIYHVGDSRAYLFREGRIIQLTRDHTYVEQLELSEEEAVVHPLKHMINRAVGISGLELDVRRFLLQAGDRLLICSDGFWNAGLLRRDLLGLALSRANSEQLADDLMDQALRRGAPDNLSLLLLERDALA
jgi:serine/threonine protein phosphatase PrpC